MSPDDPRHGSEAGYEQHVRDSEDPCAGCHQGKLLAGRRRSKRKEMGYRFTVPSDAARARITKWRAGGASYGDIADHTGLEEGRCWEIDNDGAPRVYTRTAARILKANGWPVTALGITRRVRALVRIGWAIPHIAEACGTSHDTILDIRRRQPEFISRKVRDGILAGYEQLAMQLPEPTSKQGKAGVSRARNHATRMGWLPPLAWDDIDDPNERPAVGTNHRRRDDIDHAVVERFLCGEHSLKTTPAERRQITHRWPGSLADLERITGWATWRYVVREDVA